MIETFLQQSVGGSEEGAWETRAVNLPDQDAIRQAPPEEATGAPNVRDFTALAGCRGETMPTN